MRVVLDTNVLVSALLRPEGQPGRILDLVLAGDLEPVFDDRIVAEYQEVLRRPRFGFTPQDVDALLDYLETTGLNISAHPLAVALPDPDDVPFLEVAAAGEAAALVTGNLRHYPQEAIVSSGVRVLSPADFLTWWQAQVAR